MENSSMVPSACRMSRCSLTSFTQARAWTGPGPIVMGSPDGPIVEWASSLHQVM